MQISKVWIAVIAAAVVLTGCDRAVTRIFSPYENDSRNVKRIGTAFGSPIYRITDENVSCIALFTPQGESTAISCVKDEKAGTDKGPLFK